jgi:cytochrome oxidase assembly protein ShyY1
MTIKFSWFLTAFLAFVLLVVGNLGFWQVGRYFEATETIEQYHTKHDVLPPLERLDVASDGDRGSFLHHRRGKMKGTLVPDEVHLLTARYKFQTQGFGVLIPLKTVGGKILVYIGWVPKDRLGEYLGTIDQNEVVTIEGRLTKGDNHGAKSKPAGKHLGHTTWRETNLAALKERIPDLDGDILLQAGEQAKGKIIDINDIPLGGYKGPWHLPPQRHVEYAIQWFGVGAAAIGVYLALTFRRRKREDQTPPGPDPAA